MAGENITTLLWVCAGSVILFVASIAILRQALIRIPADYFSHRGRATRHSHRSLIKKVLKMVLGTVLVGAGVVMLFTPGQGLLTILIGVTLLEFPGKYSLERWLIQRANILSVINKVRRRAGRSPLQFDD